MNFVDDNGLYLNFKGDFALTKKAASFFDFKIKGNSSINFRVDNNSQNRKFLGYYSAMQLNQVLSVQKTVTLMDGANVVARGQIVINEETEDSLSCYFVSGNANWFSLFQETLPNYSYDDQIVLMTDVVTQKSATEGIVFPLVDWGYQGQRISNSMYQSSGYRENEYQDNFINAYQDFNPCYYLHSLVKKMAKFTGVTLDGTLITDTIFTNILITGAGADISIPEKIVKENYVLVAVAINTTMSGAGQELIPCAKIVDQGLKASYNTTNYEYTAVRKGTYRCLINLVLTSSSTPSIRTIEFKKNGAQVKTWDTAATDISFNGFYWVNCLPGDKLSVTLDRYAITTIIDTSTTIRFEMDRDVTSVKSTYQNGVTSSMTPYVSPAAIVPNIKGIDLVNFLCVYFGCVASYDENSNTLSLNILDKINDQLDWSEYFISYKTAYRKDIAQTNYIKPADPKEEDIEDINKTQRNYFGGGTFISSYGNIDPKVLYTMPFAPAGEYAPSTINGIYMPYVKFYNFKEEETVSISAYAAGTFTTGTQNWKPGTIVRIRTGNFRYNGMAQIVNATATSVSIAGLFAGSSTTGTITRMSFDKVTGKNRLLYALPNYPMSSISSNTATYTDQVSVTTTTLTNLMAALYDKRKINFPLDGIKLSLAIDNITGREYNNTIGELYHNRIRNIFNRPTLKVMMLLPLSEFTSYNFTKLIYIKSVNITGLFFVHAINNYKDSVTPVEVELYMI